MAKIVAKYIAGIALLTAWLYTMYWSASSPHIGLKFFGGVWAIAATFMALFITYAFADSSDDDDEHFLLLLWATVILTNFVFWSRVAYASILDWFSGPGVLAFVTACIAGGAAVWQEVTKDRAASRAGRGATIVRFPKRRS